MLARKITLPVKYAVSKNAADGVNLSAIRYEELAQGVYA
jgi:hypothetical protein